MRWTSVFTLGIMKCVSMRSESVAHHSSHLESCERSGMNGDSAAMNSEDDLNACARATTDNGHSSSMKILFLSLEFADPLFSGNGVYARTLVRALLHTSPHATVLALCGQPPTNSGSTEFGDASRPKHDISRESSGRVSTVAATSVLPGAAAEAAGRLQVRAVSLRRWGALDRSSDSEGFAAAASEFHADVDAFAPTHVLFVDWTGALLARALFSPTPSSASDATPVGASPAMVYFNFRVFSANQIVAVSGNKGNHRCSGDSSSSKNLDKGSCNAVAESDVQFYQRMETAAMAIAHAAVALCPHDAAILDRLHLASLGQSTGISQAHDGRNSVGSSMQTSPSLLSSLRTSPPSPCLVLNPPLREDLRILARQARPSAASAGSISHTPSPTRQWLLCIARLSPEKTVEHFVRAVESAGGQNLAGLGVTPRLVGSGPNATYTAVLRKRLLKACPNAVINDFDGSPDFLAQLYSETMLNFHPARYDAYGMTIIEAAAFGAPTLVDQGGLIGASSRLRPSHGEAIAAPIADHEDRSPSGGTDAGVGAGVAGANHRAEVPEALGAEVAPAVAPTVAPTAAAVAPAPAPEKPHTSSAFSSNANSGEALLKALADPEALSAVGMRAQARALEWDAAAFGDELVSILEFAAKKASPALFVDFPEVQ